MSFNQTGAIGQIDNIPLGEFGANHKFFVAEFIRIANPKLVYDMFGTPADISPNNSNTIVFNKVLKLSTLEASPLTEGVTPTEQQFQLQRLEQSINQFGGFATTTDRLVEESISGITSQYNMRIAQQGAETMNKVVRNDLTGGTNVRFQGQAADRNAITATGMPFEDFDFMFKAFKNEDVEPMRPMTSGSQNIGTSAQRETYPVIIPWEATGLVESLDDGVGNKFVNAQDYNSQRSLWTNEYGSFKQFTFIGNNQTSTAVNTAGTPQTISLSLVFGHGAYHTTKIGASDVEIIIKPLGSAGTSDPLNQRSTIGWKAKKGAVIVQPTYMFRYEYSLGAA